MKKIFFFDLLIILASSVCIPANGQEHPLDPLSALEIGLTSQIIKSSKPTPTSYSFLTIQLKEPAKSELLPYFLSDTIPPPGSIARRSFAIVKENVVGNFFEAVVNLRTNVVESWTPFQSQHQPYVSDTEIARAEELTRASAEVRNRVAELGYEIDDVYTASWTTGYVGDDPSYTGKRRVHMFLFGEKFPGDNMFAHPFPFFVIVDISDDVVIGIENYPTHNDSDTGNQDGVEIPSKNYTYDQDLLPSTFPRDDIKPLNINFPEGPSYTVTGNVVEWQKFKMRLSFTMREGLVIHHLTYNDGGNVRPVIYRASISEMVVPYGDPRPPYHKKSEFDAGAYGLGFVSVELKAGVDCIGSVHLFGGLVTSDDGNADELVNTACISEEDAGVLWKHVDQGTEKDHTTRSRRLTLTFVARVDNYDYMFKWHLYQDASIQMETQLTGILNTNMLAIGADPTPHSLLIDPQLTAQFHQHIFAVRLDVDVDGPLNSVSMVEMVAMDEPTGSPQNPYGTGLTSRVTPLRTAGEARTKTAPLNGRVWKVSNGANLNPNNGQPVAWKLIPGNHQSMLMKEDSPVRIRANFSAFDMWVTQYVDDQLYAAGDYIGQNNTEGLPKWVGENENANIVDTDIVLWHIFGISHIPRLEDWPVMPVESCGFWFKPTGFFTVNPALDVPVLGRSKPADEL